MDQPAEQDRLIGARVGNYEVRQKLGEGGMGAVYLAEHPLIGKKVALKVLHAEFSSNDEVVRRFFNEARAVNDIQHPNIVDIIDFGVLDGDGGRALVYLIMEFLQGEALSGLLAREAPLAPSRALHIGVQIADALAASHQKQIVHRDLKPDNIILLQRSREKDVAKVLDFGIAKLTGDNQSSARTRTGMVLGTPAYMSPEQCEGRGNIDHRTDCYALGVLLYEMLTGAVPFTGEGYGEVLVQHLTQPPPPLSSVLPSLDAETESVCMRALAKNPDDRYPTMEEFMRALQDPARYVRDGGAAAWASTGELGEAAPAGANVASAGESAPVSHAGGAPVTPAPAPGGAATPPPQQGVTADTGASESPERSARRPLVIGAAAAAVLAVAGGGYLVFGSGVSAEDEGAEVGAATSDAASPDAAPPDAAPPDASPADAASEEPATVVLQIDSSPEGAEIYLDDDPEPLGETPHELEVEEGDEGRLFRLEHPNRQTREQRFVPNMARAYDLDLAPEPTPSPPPERAPEPAPEPTDEPEESDEDELDPDVIPDPFDDG